LHVIVARYLEQIEALKRTQYSSEVRGCARTPP
jgi:hypothetical protein